MRQVHALQTDCIQSVILSLLCWKGSMYYQ